MNQSLQKQSHLVVGVRLLRLLCVVHALLLYWLLLQEALGLFAVGDFLLLLCQVARCAAACAQTVTATVALEVVLCADFATVHHGKDEGDSETGETAEGEALGGLVRV